MGARKEDTGIALDAGLPKNILALQYIEMSSKIHCNYLLHSCNK